MLQLICKNRYIISRFSSTTSFLNSEVANVADQRLQATKDIPAFKRPLLIPNSQNVTAFKDRNGDFSYYDLMAGSNTLSSQILHYCGKGSNSRITYLCPNDITNPMALLAAWMSGNVAVPLSAAHPAEVLEYYINDSQSNLIITTPEYEAKLKPIAEKLKKPLLAFEHQNFINEETKNVDENSLVLNSLDKKFYENSPAFIVYTSGTTSKPKGVVISHSILEAQIESLQNAWRFGSHDTFLHSLPLHHVHGLVNAMLLPLFSGGKIVMLHKFETERVWKYLLNINKLAKDKITVFMGVPTIYSYLIDEYEKLFSKDENMKEFIKKHCQNKVRTFISGSAPLPTTVFQKWKEITGHNLLERYGMTEVGMALSNPLQQDDVRKRIPGFVGQPLPHVQVRLTNPDNNKEVLVEAHGLLDEGLWSPEENSGTSNRSIVKIKPEASNDLEIVGGLQIKGKTVFKEYWNKPEETKKEFTQDGWFVTGDMACYDQTLNSFKILGRDSCDIIKSKGYRISALEMETKLLEHKNIEDCAVIGIPDKVYGQSLVALIKCRNPEIPNAAQELEKWCVDKFATYSIPTIKILENIPRNQMGKVNKADLVKNYSTTTSSQ
ncbi:CLUMA_CG002069, isoform A [Clunio marinus]|uniref:CLUMA_CG002069, isoform A n=1 Tax=Clunio marinus TaxID=568069 RepID=A0A1J1HL77_9DIPT|nr:CLUMA_CG002069, isoform A [Clunio marinus]